jgi:hypothetical protein
MVPDDRVEGRIQKATLSKGAHLSFTYSIRNVEGTATKTGTLNAAVTEVEWRGYDSFMFNGTISGTFWTQSGSGSESGTWNEYYRKGDLAFLDQTYVTDMVIGTNTVTNTTNLHYSPSLTWIEFPLEYVNGPDKSIWSTTSPVTMMNTWERTINGDDQTKESGSDNEALEFDWICANLVKKDVGAGSFDTYWIREWVRDDEPRNQVTDYFYNETVGWWVQKDVYVDDGQGTQVRIKHYELTSSSINSPPSVGSNPKVTMNEDTTDSSVDLDYVFSDPDGDQMTFKIIESEVLSCSLDMDNRIVIGPPKDHFGNETVTVSAQDALNPPVSLIIPVEVRPVDDPPVLSEPSLSPLAGDETTVFTYAILMTDVDDLGPSSAEVMIDSYYHGMTKVSGDNRTGIRLRFSTGLEPGEHFYGFRIDGIKYPPSGYLDGPTVTAREEPYLDQGSFSPQDGDENTMFTFKVTWTGPNGEVPEEVKLRIDGTFVSLTGDGGSPPSGTVYSRVMKLPVGDHRCHFEATLGSGLFRYPESGELNGPVVTGKEDPYLSDGIVFPDVGGLSTDFDYEVIWTGPNGESPSKVVAMIDLTEEVTLTKGNGGPADGIIYSGSARLNKGDHSYHFIATYSNEEFRYPQIGDLDGPSVSSPVIGECGYDLITKSADKARYIFFAEYDYVLDVYPSEAKVILNGVEHDMSDYSGSSSSGFNCTLELILAEGTYKVSIKLMIDGLSLTAQCDDLEVEVVPDGPTDDDDDDDDDGPDNSDEKGGLFFILVLGVVLLAIVAVLAFLLVRKRVARLSAEEHYEADPGLPPPRKRR